MMPLLPGNRRQVIEEDGEITKSKLLLVEGKDETLFFNALFKKNQELVSMLDDVQIVELGGIERLKSELLALKNRTGFDDLVESMVIIRDSDGDLNAAFQSVCHILRNLGLPYPNDPGTYSESSSLKVGVYIMPGDEDGGTMLEDLCLRTQQENPIMTSVNSFFELLEDNVDEMPRNLPKAKCQVFLASMPKIVSSLGLGAQKGYWDLNHDSLSFLRNFLIEL
ncbi:DUF3226 domain-containing protein [Niallia sp. FSL K6-0212]|uniref:DUF3226 domain-containing protein n=1 Tax=Niallia sp. FSL K6-0212 TaxID=2921423 RepID=UPI0030FB412D